MAAATAMAEKRLYHTTRMIGVRAFCPRKTCGGWGEPMGTKTIDGDRVKVQQRRCTCCGATFAVMINLREESRDLDP